MSEWQSMAGLEGLSRRQTRAIRALVNCPTIEAAAEEAGIGERTLYRWLSDDQDFRDAAQQAQGDAISEASRRLVVLAIEAVDALADIMRNPTQDGAAHKRLAAATVLTQLVKLREFSDIETRLVVLEEAYSSWVRVKRD